MGRRRKNNSKSAVDKQTKSETSKASRNEMSEEHVNLHSRTAKLEKSTAEEKCEKKNGDSKSPIDVYSRLTFPLVRSSANNRDFDDGDEEETVQISFSPRFIFHSNLCMICMEKSNVVCDSCGMVSYCTARHKKEGSFKHHDLCKVLTEICAKENGLSLANGLSGDQYRVFRLKLIEIIERGMGRPLDLWEKEIVLYPRVCRTCHRFSKDLKCCAKCQIDFFCEGHEDDHAAWCKDFQVFRRVLVMQHRHGYADPEIVTAPQTVALILPGDFDTLVAQLHGHSSYYSRMDCHTYSTLSHLSTVPLTALYTLQISYPDWRSMTDCAIHVIGAEFQFECVNLQVWEHLFMHFLPNVRCLSLVFVGPELRLPAVPANLLTKVTLCSACKSIGKKINVSFHAGEFYHDFSASKQFVKPDLVCLFNAGLYRETGFETRDTWPETIREFCKTKVPVVVTSYTKHEIPRDMNRIASIRDVEIILEPRRNPFASIKPDRNFVSDDTVPLIYKNYFLAVVRGKQ